MPDHTTNSPRGLRVFLETFGCQMNVLDSQLVHGQLSALGYRWVQRWQDADVVLYNTCSVRQRAEQKVYGRLGVIRGHKQSHPHVIVGVIGCMAEREGRAIARRHPDIDLLCGPGELDKLPLLLDNLIKTSEGRRRGPETALQGDTHRRASTLAAAEDQLEMLDLSRSFSPDEHQGCAYVRITRGCNKFCTYCVVPNTRGAEVHRPPDHIVEECRRLVASGVVEITLLGQTVNHYHYDHGAAVTINGLQQPQIGRAVTEATRPANTEPGAPLRAGGRITTFAALLARIHEEVPDLQRLRFVTNFPRDFGDDILRVMRSCPRICRYLHLPVQSGSDRMLKLMNRGYCVSQYRDLIGRVRAHLPDCQIATDVICGFPTETEQDHQATAVLLGACRFKNSFIFKYSPRPGTAAIDRFADDVPDDVKRRRNNELLAVQSHISAQVHDAFVGRTVRVFAESVSTKALKSSNTADPSVTLGWDQGRRITQLSGRTDGDLIVMFDADPSLVGQIVDVRIDRAAPLTLFGRLAEEAAVL